MIKFNYESAERKARKKKAAIRRAGERRTGLRIGQTVRITTTTTDTQNREHKKVKKAILLEFFTHHALFQIGGHRECFQISQLIQMARKGMIKLCVTR